jgi:hypothetical protein
MLAPQYVVNEKGKKTAVLLPITAYKQMLKDLHDLAVVAQRREEPTINLDEMLQRVGVYDELQPSVQTGR